MAPEKSLERATFGAGCFWGVEETFRRAEEYHQQYFAKRGGGQCRTVW